MMDKDIQLIGGDIKDEPEYQNQNIDKFGFGVPEARQELDTSIFDEEVDVKKARKYDNNIDFDEGVEKNFKEYAEG